MAGFRLQWFLSSKIIVWYALGWPLANIQAYLGAMGTPVSRSTMVRVIDVAGDDRLRAIHWQNRRRVAMMAARGRPFRFVQGSWETGLAGEFASALATPAQVFERRDDRGAGSVVLRLTALVFSSYKTPALEAALNWLDSYHRFIGSGGVLRFASRRSLDKAFSVEEPLPHNLAIQRGAIRPNSIGGDLNTASPYVRQAVVSALRMVDQPGDDGWRPSLRSKRSRSFLDMDEPDDADLWDPVTRGRSRASVSGVGLASKPANLSTTCSNMKQSKVLPPARFDAKEAKNDGGHANLPVGGHRPPR